VPLVAGDSDYCCVCGASSRLAAAGAGSRSCCLAQSPFDRVCLLRPIKAFTIGPSAEHSQSKVLCVRFAEADARKTNSHLGNQYRKDRPMASRSGRIGPAIDGRLATGSHVGGVTFKSVCPVETGNGGLVGDQLLLSY
jgi:hypothetical protein